MTHQPRHDRFTLPRDIPSPDHPELVEGSSFSFGAAPEEKAMLRQAQHEREGEHRPDAPTHPAGRGWVPLSRDLGIPAEHATDDPLGAAGHSAVFTLERRIRFLDHLALKGNVRAAAARVGVSHETAYRKRRQDADFAALWDAAMVHARAHAEAVLATRALDGVEVPVTYHGEITGYEIHHDTRLLLAHLARLDRKMAEDTHAAARAGRFDELLAAYAGHEEPEGFAEAAEEALDRQDRTDAPPLPPTRQDYVVFRRGEAMGGADADEEAEAMAEAAEAAGEEWDEWHCSSVACVSAIVETPLPLAGGAQHSPLPPAGGAGGGPVAQPDPSNIPSPNPSREREGEPAPVSTLVIPSNEGTQRAKAPEGPPESAPHPDSTFPSRNPVTSVNPAGTNPPLARSTPA